MRAWQVSAVPSAFLRDLDRVGLHWMESGRVRLG